MLSVGFPISHKENEKRRALLPQHVRCVSHPEMLFFEEGYGEAIGIDDAEYKAAGAQVCSRQEVLSKAVICDPKVGDAEYLTSLHAGQCIFGWIHATQNYDITDKIMSAGLTAYAWEHMYEGARHVFWRNNELAGEAAVLHAYQCFGVMPYETKVAVIGRGNTARGAVKILNMHGADVYQYDRRTEELLKNELSQFDVIVNCVLWDIMRSDHIIAREDLKKMKKHSLIIDVSCDRGGAVETSVPTTIDDPVYEIDGVVHYVVDHTPALFSKTFTNNNSQILYPYIDELVNECPGQVLCSARIFENGAVLDEEIKKYQHR